MVVLVYKQHAHLNKPILRVRALLWAFALDSSPEPGNAKVGKREEAELERALMCWGQCS